jgi:uncharacterized protein HemX
MRAARALVAVVFVAGLSGTLAACGKSQQERFGEQLQKAGYTNVSTRIDYASKYNRKKKKTEKRIDEYEATAKAGACQLDIEQKPSSTTYTVKKANGKDVSFVNLTAQALVAELAKQGVTC